MCGIAGFVTLQADRSSQCLETIGEAMAGRLAHRGPDARGVWSDAGAGVCLAHRRLSIVDLSAAGRQPMVSGDGRHVLVFNGEIYNHRDLRHALEAETGGVCWRGHSDTEVLLELIARRGVAVALSKAAGMFALAVFDRARRVLTLARDRVGEKPLYYGRQGEAFLFGSELKSLAAHPAWSPRLNRDVLPSYLRYGYVPAPHSIYEGVRKLEPGHFLTLNVDGGACEPRSAPYWEFPLPRGVAVSEDEAVEALDARLRGAVRRQLEADVPVGCFLSGGIDSSTVAALAQAEASRPVRTFSIGFDDPRMNEAPFAAAVAKHLHTDHTELFVTAAMAQETAPHLAEIYDEPFADSSQIPTLLLSRLTRRHVTVALSGDGGDELFGGYDRYELLGRTLWAFRTPAAMRNAAAAVLGHAPTGLLERFARKLSPSVGALNPSRIERMQAFLRHPSGYDAYRDLMSTFAQPARLLAADGELATRLDREESRRCVDGVLPWAAYIDAVSYLPDDILVKVDRASMSTSLEVRVPMLDPEVIELAASLPWELKRRGGVSKWPLRAVLERYVPRALFERPKMGFGVPMAEWLRGDLRDWAQSLLTGRVGLLGDVLDAGEVGRLWDEHLSGARDHKARIWTVLMLQQWAVDHGFGDRPA
jgi:asparagine synthase (glutamine-hydrolysing)